MAQTKIEWTATVLDDGTIIPGYTFNPWLGCTKVSPGCTFCYAEAMMDHRYGRVKWGKGQARSRTSAANWAKPLAWNRKAAKEGIRSKVFCASLADWLDDEVPIGWLADLLVLIDETPHLDWLLLTKRPENWSHRLNLLSLGDRQSEPAAMIACDWLDGDYPENVWVGTTVEDQKRADDRLPALMQIPAVVRFLSVEPLLEDVTIPRLDSSYRDVTYISGLWDESDLLPSWVIVGGESGHGARPFNLEWARSIVRQCKSAEVPVFVKQLGSNPVDADGNAIASAGKGGELADFPEDLQIREFPVVQQLAAV